MKEGTELICESARCPGSATRLELLPKAADAEGRDDQQKEEGGRRRESEYFDDPPSLLPSLVA